MVVNLLKKVTLFDDLSDEQLLMLSKVMNVIVSGKGESVFEAGDIDRALYIVKSGEVSIKLGVCIDRKEAKPSILKLKAGDYFGEMALIEKAPRSATAVSMMDSELVVLRADMFDSVIENFMDIGYVIVKNLAKLLSQRLRETNGRLQKSLSDRYSD